MKIALLFAFTAFVVDSVPVEKPAVEPEYLDQLLAEGRYVEFSYLLGISNPRLAMPRNASDKNDPAAVDPSFIKGLFEGDILWTPTEEENARHGINFQKYPGSKWNGEVPYTISTTYTAAQRDTIQNAINAWNADFNNCIRLVPRVNQADYCHFFSGDGCYANLGKVGKQQPISLQSNGCLSRGTILHEIEHSIGLIHEQCMPGRNTYVKVLLENIPSDWQPQYKEESSSNFNNLGSYECASVMHYPVNAPGTGKPAFEWVGNSCPDKTQVGQRRGLTNLDKAKVKKQYNC